MNKLKENKLYSTTLLEECNHSNQGLYKRLKVNMEKPYIMSPTNPSEKIFCIFDTLHCYKNFFASLMDNIACNPDTGHNWSKLDFEALLEKTNSEITPLFR